MFQQPTGHEEKRHDIPDPLGGPRFHPWKKALPAHLLSWVSIAVLAAVFLVPLADERLRRLFKLPVEPLWLAGVATLLAGTVLLVGRGRPGRLFPRVWALLLTILAAADCAAVLLTRGEEPALLHLASLALSASAVSLLPRLARLGPDSVWLQRIAPASLLGVLLVVLPASWYVGRLAVRQQEIAIDGFLARIERMSATVREVAGHDWTRMWSGRDAAREKLERLEALRVPPQYGSPAFWEVAEILGREAELEKAATELTGAVVDGFDPERTPKLSASPEPAVWWEPTGHRWQEASDFAEVSDFVGRYHRGFGRLFQELGIAPEKAERSAPLRRVALGHSQARVRLRAHLEAALDSWTDHWAVFRTPDHEDLVGVPALGTGALLLTPITGAGAAIVPAKLGDLLQISFAESSALGVELPGCHPRSYGEGSYEYHRLDCYTYLPGSNGTQGAELRLDLRIVYRSEYNRSLSAATRPVEIYFLFPIPDGTDPDDFQSEVMNGFRQAIEQNWHGMITNRDTSGTTRTGFILRGDPEDLAVVAKIEDYGFKHDFLVVRAFPYTN